MPIIVVFLAGGFVAAATAYAFYTPTHVTVNLERQAKKQAEKQANEGPVRLECYLGKNAKGGAIAPFVDIKGIRQGDIECISLRDDAQRELSFNERPKGNTFVVRVTWSAPPEELNKPPKPEPSEWPGIAKEPVNAAQPPYYILDATIAGRRHEIKVDKGWYVGREQLGYVLSLIGSGGIF